MSVSHGADRREAVRAAGGGEFGDGQTAMQISVRASGTGAVPFSCTPPRRRQVNQYNIEVENEGRDMADADDSITRTKIGHIKYLTEYALILMNCAIAFLDAYF